MVSGFCLFVIFQKYGCTISQGPEIHGFWYCDPVLPCLRTGYENAFFGVDVYE
jgi:hypothetical protein